MNKMKILLYLFTLFVTVLASYKYHVAMKSNEKGINWLRNHILEHISNPRSDKYGNYLSNEIINHLVKPSEKNIQLVRKWLEQQGVNDYMVHGDIVSFNTNKYFNPVLPKNLRKIVDYVSTPSFHFPKKVRQKFDYPSNGFVTREVIMKLYNMYGDGYVNPKHSDLEVLELQA